MGNRIRQCIFKFGSEDSEFLSGEVEMGEDYFGGRRKVKRERGAKKQRVRYPVFGILEREGPVKVESMKEKFLKFPVGSRKYFVYYLKELEFRCNFRANLDKMLYNMVGGIK
jgi:hypothetical protein